MIFCAICRERENLDLLVDFMSLQQKEECKERQVKDCVKGGKTKSKYQL
jgi:hypothetical protein